MYNLYFLRELKKLMESALRAVFAETRNRLGHRGHNAIYLHRGTMATSGPTLLLNEI